jgi:hypothetical protein
MSIEAMSWVLKQDMSRSSEKFILVCLANYADERGICYPSTATLARDTGQDRKTVILNLKRLGETGMLRDTGQRVGRTRGVIVYQLVGMPSNSAVHYVFRVTNLETGEFYVGARSFNGDPELDVFRGSGRWVVDMQGRAIPLHREVLEVFDNTVEAKAAELRLFREVGTDNLCRNESAPHGASRDLKYMRAEALKNEAAGSDTVFGTAPSSTVFPGSSTVFPGSSTVFPPKQSQKRDTEPSVEPSDKPSEKTTTKKAASKSKAPPAAPVVVLPDWLPESTWNDWIEHRAGPCKAPLTQRAAELCIVELGKMRAVGQDPEAVINQSILSGKWPSLYAVKAPQQPQAAGGKARPAKFDPTAYVNQTGEFHRPAKFNPMNSGAFDEPAAHRCTSPYENHGDIIDVEARSVDATA